MHIKILQFTILVDVWLIEDYHSGNVHAPSIFSVRLVCSACVSTLLTPQALPLLQFRPYFNQRQDLKGEREKEKKKKKREEIKEIHKEKKRKKLKETTLLLP